MNDPYSNEFDDIGHYSADKRESGHSGGLKKNFSLTSKISFDPPQFQLTGPIYSNGWVGATGGNRDFNQTSHKELLASQEIKQVCEFKVVSMRSSINSFNNISEIQGRKVDSPVLNIVKKIKNPHKKQKENRVQSAKVHPPSTFTNSTGTGGTTSGKQSRTAYNTRSSTQANTTQSIANNIRRKKPVRKSERIDSALSKTSFFEAQNTLNNTLNISEGTLRQQSSNCGSVHRIRRNTLGRLKHNKSKSEANLNKPLERKRGSSREGGASHSCKRRQRSSNLYSRNYKAAKPVEKVNASTVGVENISFLNKKKLQQKSLDQATVTRIASVDRMIKKNIKVAQEKILRAAEEKLIEIQVKLKKKKELCEKSKAQRKLNETKVRKKQMNQTIQIHQIGEGGLKSLGGMVCSQEKLEKHSGPRTGSSNSIFNQIKSKIGSGGTQTHPSNPSPALNQSQSNSQFTRSPMKKSKSKKQHPLNGCKGGTFDQEEQIVLASISPNTLDVNGKLNNAPEIKNKKGVREFMVRKKQEQVHKAQIEKRAENKRVQKLYANLRSLDNFSKASRKQTSSERDKKKKEKLYSTLNITQKLGESLSGLIGGSSKKKSKFRLEKAEAADQSANIISHSLGGGLAATGSSGAQSGNDFYFEYLNILKNLNGYPPIKKVFKGKNSPEKAIKSLEQIQSKQARPKSAGKKSKREVSSAKQIKNPKENNERTQHTRNSENLQSFDMAEQLEKLKNLHLVSSSHKLTDLPNHNHPLVLQPQIDFYHQPQKENNQGKSAGVFDYIVPTVPINQNSLLYQNNADEDSIVFIPSANRELSQKRPSNQEGMNDSKILDFVWKGADGLNLKEQHPFLTNFVVKIQRAWRNYQNKEREVFLHSFEDGSVQALGNLEEEMSIRGGGTGSQDMEQERISMEDDETEEKVFQISELGSILGSVASSQGNKVIYSQIDSKNNTQKLIQSMLTTQVLGKSGDVASQSNINELQQDSVDNSSGSGCGIGGDKAIVEYENYNFEEDQDMISSDGLQIGVNNPNGQYINEMNFGLRMLSGSESRFREFIESSTPRDDKIMDSGSTGDQPREQAVQFQTSSTSSVFDRNPFFDFTTAKMNELIQTGDFQYLIKLRETALQARADTESKFLKKMLKSQQYSPRTYQNKKIDLEKWVTKEAQEIKEAKTQFQVQMEKTVNIIQESQKNTEILTNYLEEARQKKQEEEEVMSQRSEKSIRSQSQENISISIEENISRKEKVQIFDEFQLISPREVLQGSISAKQLKNSRQLLSLLDEQSQAKKGSQANQGSAIQIIESVTSQKDQFIAEQINQIDEEPLIENSVDGEQVVITGEDQPAPEVLDQSQEPVLPQIDFEVSQKYQKEDDNNELAREEKKQEIESNPINFHEDINENQAMISVSINYTHKEDITDSQPITHTNQIPNSRPVIHHDDHLFKPRELVTSITPQPTQDIKNLFTELFDTQLSRTLKTQMNSSAGSSIKIKDLLFTEGINHNKTNLNRTQPMTGVGSILIEGAGALPNQGSTESVATSQASVISGPICSGIIATDDTDESPVEDINETPLVMQGSDVKCDLITADLFEQIFEEEIEKSMKMHLDKKVGAMEKKKLELQKQVMRKLAFLDKGIKTDIFEIEKYINQIIDQILGKLCFVKFLENESSFIHNLLTPITRDPLEDLDRMQAHSKLGRAMPHALQIPQSLCHQPILNIELYLNIERLKEEDYNNDSTASVETVIAESEHIHNKMVFDSINETLDQFRPYGKDGVPMPWSQRTRKLRTDEILDFEKIFEIVKHDLFRWAITQAGTLPRSEFVFEQQFDEELFAEIREKKLATLLATEVLESEQQWLNFDYEDAQVKIDLSNMIFEKLISETVDTLEAIEITRNIDPKFNQDPITQRNV